MWCEGTDHVQLVQMLQLRRSSEVESRTQGSRPRTQKNPRPKPRPRTALPRTDSLEAKDRNAWGQGPWTQMQVFSKKKFFSGDLQKKRSSKIFFLGLELRSRGFYVQAYAADLAVLVTDAEICLGSEVWPKTRLWNKSYTLAARKPKLCSSLTNGIQIWVLSRIIILNSWLAIRCILMRTWLIYCFCRFFFYLEYSRYSG